MCWDRWVEAEEGTGTLLRHPGSLRPCAEVSDPLLPAMVPASAERLEDATVAAAR